MLLNRGGGRFGAARAYATGQEGDQRGAWSVAIGDLNGDGAKDLATANPGGHSVSVLLNRGDGAFASSVTYPIGRQPRDLAIVDLNGDGKNDISTANPNTVSVLRGNGDGTFQDKLEYSTGRPSDNRAFVVGDLSSDGKPDLATRITSATRSPSSSTAAAASSPARTAVQAWHAIDRDRRHGRRRRAGSRNGERHLGLHRLDRLDLGATEPRGRQISE